MPELDTLIKNPEANGQLNSQLAELQLGREANAKAAAEVLQWKAFNAPNSAADPNCALTRVEANIPGMFDVGTVSARELVALEALGLSSSDIFKQHSHGEAQPLVAELPIGAGSETISVYKFGSWGVSLRLRDGRSGPSGKPSEKIKELVTSRFSNSPIHAEIQRVTGELGYGAWPQEVATLPVKAFIDPLGTLAFLEDSGFALYEFDISKALARGEPALTVLSQVLEQTLGPESKDGIRRYEWGRGGVKSIAYDARNDTFTFACRQVPADLYGEQPNQSPGIEDKSQPFVLSEHAKCLFAALDQADLMIAPKLQEQIMQVGESDRYGSIYTQMTREIAKWVDRPGRFILSNLFVPKDSKQLGRALIRSQRERSYSESQLGTSDEKIEEVAKDRLMRIDSANMTLPMQTLVDLAQQVASRDGTVASDLPVTSRDIKFVGMTCFDTYTYYLGSEPAELRRERHGSATLLHKTNGKPSYLSTAPMTFNGINLPQGSLFQCCPDGKWAFLQLTPFAFDSSSDQQVFGSEITKSNRNYVDLTAGRIGGVSLAMLNRRATTA